jgi:hypothetical protein
MYEVLLSGVDETGASAVLYAQHFRQRQFVVAQVDITDTATVQVQGRIGPDFDWVILYEFTASGAQQVTAMSQMRFEVTAYTGGTVDAGLAG